MRHIITAHFEVANDEDGSDQEEQQQHGAHVEHRGHAAEHRLDNDAQPGRALDHEQQPPLLPCG